MDLRAGFAEEWDKREECKELTMIKVVVVVTALYSESVLCGSLVGGGCSVLGSLLSPHFMTLNRLMIYLFVLPARWWQLCNI